MYILTTDLEQDMVHNHRKLIDLQEEMAALKNKEWKSDPCFTLLGVPEFTYFAKSCIAKSPLHRVFTWKVANLWTFIIEA